MHKCNHQAYHYIFQLQYFNSSINTGYYVIDGENLAGNGSPVQKEVQYSPKVEWVAYDISFKTTDDEDKQGNKLIHFVFQ